MSEGMELSEFITQTIGSIVKGVSDAKKKVATFGDNALINPVRMNEAHSDPEAVHFDIAIAVTDNSEIAGKAGLKLSVPVIGVNIGGDAKSTTQMTNTSRINFSVKIALPSSSAERYPQAKAAWDNREPQDWKVV